MAQWIEGLIGDRFKNASELANAIGMTDSGFSRATRAGTFDVENCLKLAYVTDTPAHTVLRLAGKDEVNTLIETLYGKPASTDVIANAKIVRLLNALTAEEREAMVNLISAIAASGADDGPRSAQAHAPTHERRPGPARGAKKR